jgi:hypothetical protein
MELRNSLRCSQDSSNGLRSESIESSPFKLCVFITVPYLSCSILQLFIRNFSFLFPAIYVQIYCSLYPTLWHKFPAVTRNTVHSSRMRTDGPTWTRACRSPVTRASVKHQDSSNLEAEWTALLVRIREGRLSILGLKIGNPGRSLSCFS